MQFSVDLDLSEHFTAINLEAAIVIMKAAARQTAYSPVENPARPDLVPRVVTPPLPTAHDIERTALDGVEESRYLGWIVLEVGIKRQNQSAAGGVESGCERRGLAEIPTEPNPPNARIGSGELQDQVP